MEVIATHDNVDFDALASLIAAQKIFPNAKIIFSGTHEKGVRDYLQAFGNLWSLEKNKNININDIKKIIVVDTRLPSRIGKLANVLDKKDVKIIIFDHHPNSSRDIKSTSDYSQEYGASITILLEKIKNKKIIISRHEATLFCIGLYEDTGSLSYSSTTPHDVKMAAWLLEKGADLNIVAEFIRYELSPEQKIILEKLVENLKEFNINGIKVIISYVPVKDYTGDLAIITHHFRDVYNLNVVFTLFQMEDRIHLIARSRLDIVAVNKIVSVFGGFGHSRAASATIREFSLKEIIDKLLLTLDKNIQPFIYARDLMASPVITVSPDINISELKKMMLRFNHTGFPVVENGRLIGMIVRSDIERLMSHKLGGEQVRDYMTTEISTVSPDTPVVDINRLLVEKDIGRLPVLDNGKLVGIVTRSDLIRVFHRSHPSLDIKTDKSLFERPLKISDEKNLLPLIRNKIPIWLKNLLEKIGIIGKKYNFIVYIVGGFVRDIIIGRRNYDIDIVVEGDGIDFSKHLARELNGRVVEHKKFRTAIVTLKNGPKIDIATARTEFYEYPAALPTVEKSSIRYDLYRRDFSLNALAINLHPDHFGQLLDFFGGRRDIKHGIIRVLYNLSFVDDPTRILRAVRFEQRYNFTIDKQTEYLLKNALKLGVLDKTAPERLREELILILSEENPILAFLRMENLGILSWIHTGLKINHVTRRIMSRINEVLSWVKLSFLKDYFTVWIIYFLAIVEQMEKEEIESLIKKFKFSSDESKIIRESKTILPDIYSRIKSDKKMLPSEIYKILSPLSLETLLFLMAKAENTQVQKRIASFLTIYRNEKCKLTGRDLIKLKLVPSPVFKGILEKVFFAQMDGKIKTKGDGMRLVKKFAKIQ